MNDRQTIEPQLLELIESTVALLTEGRFEELAKLSHGVRMSAAAMRRALCEYGRTLAIPPKDLYRYLSIVEVSSSGPRKWSIAVPLWTEEEGRSDLTLELTATETPTGLTLEIDNLHVQ